MYRISQICQWTILTFLSISLLISTLTPCNVCNRRGWVEAAQAWACKGLPKQVKPRLGCFEFEYNSNELGQEGASGDKFEISQRIHCFNPVTGNRTNSSALQGYCFQDWLRSQIQQHVYYGLFIVSPSKYFRL